MQSFFKKDIMPAFDGLNKYGPLHPYYNQVHYEL